MAATVIGTINFGLDAETGLFAESISFDPTIQERYIADGDGDHVAGALYGASANFSIEGAFNTSGSPTWTLGSQLTIANAPSWTAFFTGYSSGGRVILTSGNIGLGNESEERRTLGGVFKPFMTAS
jgi:hypothetical protein